MENENNLLFKYDNDMYKFDIEMILNSLKDLNNTLNFDKMYFDYSIEFIKYNIKRLEKINYNYGKISIMKNDLNNYNDFELKNYLKLLINLTYKNLINIYKNL